MSKVMQQLSRVAKSIFTTATVGGKPRVRVAVPELDAVARPSWYEQSKPDEASYDAAELRDLLAAYPSLPYVFACVHKIAASMCVVPLKLYERVLTEPATYESVGMGFVADPAQGSMPMVQAKRYRSPNVETLLKAEVGGEDEFSASMIENELEIKEHPLLYLLRNPNPLVPSTNFFYAHYAYLELTGNCYWLLERNELGDIKSIWMPRPDRIRPVYVNSSLKYQQYSAAGKETRKWDPEDVIQFKYFNPLSEIFGMAPLRAAVDSIITDLYCIKYNKTYFQNSGRPDLLLITEDTLDEDTYKRILSEWDRMFRGMDKSHRPALIEGGMRVELLSKSSRADMEFSKQRERNREDALGVLGVHPILLGIGDRSFTDGTYNAIRRAFWEDTLLPKMAMTAEHIETYLFPKTHPIDPKVHARMIRMEMERTQGTLESAAKTVRTLVTPLDEELAKFSVRYDTRNIRALRESQQIESQVNMRYSQAAIMTINEIRRTLGLPPVPWGDVPPKTSPIGISMMRGDINEARTLLEPRHMIDPQDLEQDDAVLRQELGLSKRDVV